MALILGALVIVLGALGYVFKDRLFGKTVIVTPPVDTVASRKKTPEMIAKENMDKVVQIEFGWQLFDGATNNELWHRYTVVKGQDGQDRYVAMYIQNSRGQIEPYLDVQKNVQIGTPVGFSGATGSGFVVSEDGFILTNRHVATNWNTRYSFADYAFPGVLIQNVGGKQVIAEGVSVMPENVFGWVPSETIMVAWTSNALATSTRRLTS